MANEIFTAVYSKEGKAVVDISLRSDHDKLLEIKNFIDSLGYKVQAIENVGIITFLIDSDSTELQKCNSIIESFYAFIE